MFGSSDGALAEPHVRKPPVKPVAVTVNILGDQKLGQFYWFIAYYSWAEDSGKNYCQIQPEFTYTTKHNKF
jgi:hypothetical protein